MGSPALASSSFLHSLVYSWSGRQVKYKAGVFSGFNPAKGEKWEDACDGVCVNVWVFKRDRADCPFWCVYSDFLCVDTYAVTEGDPRCQRFIMSGSFARPDSHWLSVLLPDCVSWTVLSLMECFCLWSHPEQKGSESYITGSVTGSQNRRAMNMQALPQTAGKKKKKCLMWLNLKISNFAILKQQLWHFQHISLRVSLSAQFPPCSRSWRREFLPRFITKY